MLKYILGFLFLATTASAQTAIGVFDELQNQSTTKNWVTNPHAEKNSASVTAYADTAGTDPVDAVGGSPTVSCTRSSSNPIDGLGSFLLTKDAANRQGEGCAWTVKALSTSMKAKVISVEFDYLLSSGTFVAGTASARSDVTVWLIPLDGSDTTAKQLSTISLFSNSTTITDKFSGYFQTASDTTQYRLALHVGSTSASAYTLKIDNVRFSQAKYSYGTPVTDWQSFSPTISTGTHTINRAFWRRVGDSVEVTIDHSTSSAGSGLYSYPLPSGLAIDTSVHATTTLTSGASNTTQPFNSIIGEAQYRVGNAVRYSLGTVVVATSSTVQILFSGQSSGVSWSANGNAFADSGTGHGSASSGVGSSSTSLKYRAKISGWSSSTQVSSDSGYRDIEVVYTGNAATALTANTTNIDFSTKVIDTHSAWNGTTFTAPRASSCSVSASVNTSASVSIGIEAYVNGTQYRRIHSDQAANAVKTSSALLIPLNANDTLTFRSTGAATLANSALFHWVSIRCAGASQTIAAQDVVAFRARTSTTAATTSTPFIFTLVQGDTHDMYDEGTGIVRVPFSGWYQINVNVYTNSIYTLRLYINGSIATQFQASGTSGQGSGGADLRRLNAGDTIQVRPDTNATASAANQELNFFSMFRVAP
jgi:hypothetical protein